MIVQNRVQCIKLFENRLRISRSQIDLLEKRFNRRIFKRDTVNNNTPERQKIFRKNHRQFKFKRNMITFGSHGIAIPKKTKP